MPRNSLVNGKLAPDTGGDQLDETAYPILMAYQAGLQGDEALWRDHMQQGRGLRRRARPVVRLRAVGGAGRLLAVDDRGRDRRAGRGRRGSPTRNGDHASAPGLPRHRRPLPARIKGWTVTTTGPYATGRYFIRLSKTGDPNAAITYNLGNGGPDADQRAVVDAGLPGADPARHPAARTTPTCAARCRSSTQTIRRDDRERTGLLPVRHRPTAGHRGRVRRLLRAGRHRPAQPAGKPWPTGNTGSGHLWPVLSGERAEQQLQTGDRAGATAAAARR